LLIARVDCPEIFSVFKTPDMATASYFKARWQGDSPMNRLAAHG